MKLFKILSLLGAAAGTVGLVVMSAEGCSSSSSTAPATASTVGVPPASPADAVPTTDTSSRTFAVDKLFLGETDRTGAPVKDAWKSYGYNIDGLTTTATDMNVCSRVGGADSAKQIDGNDGIDNAFGKTILAFILGLAPTPSKTINDSIAKGSFTILLTVKGLTDVPTQTNTGLSGDLRIGGNFAPDGGPQPDFTNTSLDWPYRMNPIVPITGAYINNGTFVNGSGGAQVELSLFISGVALDLTINRAAITFDHSAPNDITNGTISGVIGTEALVSGIEKVAGRISTQLCGGSTLDTIKQTIRAASDILQNGTNMPGVPCDAISIGIGFTGKKIGAPKTVAMDVAPPADPCKADGGM